MNINEYYQDAHSGDIVDNTQMLEYIRSFKNVILWGASYLGEAVGKYLIKNDIHVKNYWDLRCNDLLKINGIEVVMPFSTEDKQNTIVVFCIGNNVIRHALLHELKENGYVNMIRGDFIYEAAICPFNKTTGIASSQCQGSMCCRSIFCERLSNIVKSRSKNANPLHMFSITLIINQRCSLKCKCCTSYMNQYPLEKRKDIPLEKICDDIDKFFDAMDSVGTVTVMGGEPFMHPDLSPIIKKLLTKNNFGIISIATSGTYPINYQQLEGLNDKRVNISFSNYEQSLNEKQKEIMYKNIAMVKKAGLSYTVGITMPEWLIPSTLYDLGDSEERMIQKKKACTQPPRCMQVKDGKLFPCDFGNAIYSLGIADYEMDYVDLKNSTSKEQLRESIRKFVDQPYYKSCGYCFSGNGTTTKAAEQGYIDFTKPLNFN